MPPLPNNSGRAFLRVALVVLSLGLPLVASAQVVNATKEPPPKLPDVKNAPIDGFATWYDVPAKSRVKQRAPKDELTAAHNRLPIGTRLRVTHLGNQKNVVVRITDRLVSKRPAHVDLSKEAAEKLDMVKQGSARVRMEVLPNDNTPAPQPKPAHWWQRSYWFGGGS